MQGIGRYCRGSAGEQGAILVTALLMLVAFAAIGAGVVTLTSVDTLTTGNYKLATQAFYAAEAGTEESRGRLRANAGANLIADPDKQSTQWRAYVGNTTQAKVLWPTTTQQYTPQASLPEIVQAGLNYAVEIRHKTTADFNPLAPNPPPNPPQVLFWGDAAGTGSSTQNITTAPPKGTNVYVVTSYGSTSTGTRELQIEVAPFPPITIPAALYVQDQTTIQGAATFVNGFDDSCANSLSSVPGIATTLPGPPSPDPVTANGNPSITGSPAITYGAPKLDIQAMVNALKAGAIEPTPQSGVLTGGNWGTPTGGSQGSKTTLPTASSCSTSNSVHFNTGGTQIKLTGGTSGCGILLVEGDLNIDGGFAWYGPILVTGSVTYAGGGNKLVTGAILSGGKVVADLVGGNANIEYCSTAISNQTKNRPLQILSWKEL